jgi:hypothetical protein
MKYILKLFILVQVLGVALLCASSATLPQTHELKMNPLISKGALQSLSQVEIPQVRGTVDLRVKNPQLNLSQVIRNKSTQEMSYTISAKGLAPKKVIVPQKQRKAVTLKLPVNVQKVGKFSAMTKITPQVLVNKSTTVNPVKDFSIKVHLPEAAKKVIKSNKPLFSKRQADGTVVYDWRGKNKYMTPLHIWWTSSETDIDLTKQIDVDSKKGIVKVTIMVKNNGSSNAKNIRLSEDFPVQNFRGLEQTSNGKFKKIKGDVNDNRLVWESTLNNLPAGQSKKVEYRLQTLFPM